MLISLTGVAYCMARRARQALLLYAALFCLCIAGFIVACTWYEHMRPAGYTLVASELHTGPDAHSQLLALCQNARPSHTQTGTVMVPNFA